MMVTVMVCTTVYIVVQLHCLLLYIFLTTLIYIMHILALVYTIYMIFIINIDIYLLVDKLEKGENVVILSNHQTEADPQVYIYATYNFAVIKYAILSMQCNLCAYMFLYTCALKHRKKFIGKN
jgi:1-acyl-sn-glycerol-3-phosphate acyltransferase